MKKIKVIFVCLGNICRSPMAELYFKSLAEREGKSEYFDVLSFGTSDEEEGNGIYPPAAQALARHGIFGSHNARQISFADIADADYVLAMDSGNIRSLARITGGRFSEKIHKLCDFTDRPRDVADPWYTRDFEKAYSDIADGCEGFLRRCEAYGFGKSFT